MNAHQLAKELLSMPNIPVRVVTNTVVFTDDAGDPIEHLLAAEVDPTEADQVRYEGSYILVQGK